MLLFAHNNSTEPPPRNGEQISFVSVGINSKIFFAPLNFPPGYLSRGRPGDNNFFFGLEITDMKGRVELN